MNVGDACEIKHLFWHQTNKLIVAPPASQCEKHG